MSLPGSAAIPAPYRDRQENAYRTGKRIVEMVREDLKPSRHPDPRRLPQRDRRQLGDRRLDQRADPPRRDRAAHGRRARRSATGRSTATRCRCWSTCSRPASISARITTAPAACRRWSSQLIGAGADPRGRADRQRPHASATTAATPQIEDEKVIRRSPSRCAPTPGFVVLSGNLFDSAIMKTSVISDEFRARYLSNPDDPDAFEGPVVVFDGPEDYHARIDDPALGSTPSTLAGHARRRADRLSGRGRGREHARARLPAARGRARAALHRRRAAVGHLRQPVDPQRLARSGGGRRAGAAAHRRPGADRPATAARPTC